MITMKIEGKVTLFFKKIREKSRRNLLSQGPLVLLKTRKIRESLLTFWHRPRFQFCLKKLDQCIVASFVRICTFPALLGGFFGSSASNQPSYCILRISYRSTQCQHDRLHGADDLTNAAVPSFERECVAGVAFCA